MYDPLIPDEFYEECVQTDDPKEVMAIIDRIQPINRLVDNFHIICYFYLNMLILLGADILDPLPARVLSTRSRDLYKDGFVKSRNGIRTEPSPMHFSGSESNSRKYSKGDELHPGVDHQHGYVVCCAFNLSRFLFGVRQ